MREEVFAPKSFVQVTRSLEGFVPGLQMDPSCLIKTSESTEGVAVFARLVTAGTFGYISEDDFWNLAYRCQGGGVGIFSQCLGNPSIIDPALRGQLLVFGGVRLLEKNPRWGTDSKKFVAYFEWKENPHTRDMEWRLGVHCTYTPYWPANSCLVRGVKLSTSA